ncbi:MAG: DUF4838 domain-containing protein [Armatimonadetes bacterium]|nr:DUF4838 domain-containing protein [Armatimonadota bacterium]
MRQMLIPILIAGTAVSAAADRFVICEGGRARAAIVVAKDATEPMRIGASEIRKHIEMISGAQLPVIEAENAQKPAIPKGYRGMIVISNRETDPQTKQAIAFRSEEYTIRTVPGAPYQIRISGDGKRGALYGCYTFLEDALGCRWYTPAITKAPRKKTVEVQSLWIRQKPDFEYREPFFQEAFDKMWAVRNKTNGNTQQLDDSVGGKITYGRFVHTFDELVPQSYFAEHPEYFSLINGKRMEGYAQLCLTNPDVLKISIAKVREWLKNDPKSTIFSVSQNDTGYPCECENCSAVVKEEGAQSGPILRFVNAVADDIAKDYPHVLIDTLAYAYSEAPPKFVKPLPNVRVRMCPISNCVGHPMDRCERNEKPYQNLLTWSRITDQLYIWHYSTDFANYLMPLPSLDDIATSIPIYKKSGAVGLFYQGSYQSPGGALAELKSYLCAKLMWDASQNPKAIVSDYLKGVYGKAAPVMQVWLDLLHSEIRKSPKNHAFIYDSPRNVYLTDDVVSGSYKLLDQASVAAASDADALREIEKARMWMRYVSLTRRPIQYRIVGNEYQAVSDSAGSDLQEKFARNLSEFRVTHLREGSTDIEGFMKSLDHKEGFRAYILENDTLKVDIVPGIGGRIVGMTIKKNNANIFKEASSGLSLASGGYEEYFNYEYKGKGYSETYEVDEARTTSSSVAMKLEPYSGIGATRTISLSDQTVTIATSVTNNGSAPYVLKMRTHPEFAIPEQAKPTCSFVDISGKSVSQPFTEGEENRFFSGRDLPNGKWTVDLGSYSVTNLFDPGQVSQALLNDTTAGSRFNLELYSTEVTVNPGETVTFTNSIQVQWP